MSLFQPHHPTHRLLCLYLGSVHNLHRHFESQGSSLPNLTPGTHLATHQLHKLTANRQAQARPFLYLAATCRLYKGIKDTLLFSGGNTEAGVFNLEETLS